MDRRSMLGVLGGFFGLSIVSEEKERIHVGEKSYPIVGSELLSPKDYLVWVLGYSEQEADELMSRTKEPIKLTHPSIENPHPQYG